MADGWIKLHRELVEKAIWKESSPEQKVVLVTLLTLANHQEKEWEWKGKRYKAKPGQFVTSLESIAQKCGKGISIQNVRTAIKRLEKYEFLTNESTNRNRLITIVNWELYQSKESETNKPTNKQLTSNQQATNKQLTTNKNDKNDKNVRKETSNKFSDDSFEMKMVDYLISQIRRLNQNFKEPNKQTWCGHIEKMIRLDKRSHEDIKRTLEFATNSSFWQTNILSTKKFREKFDTLFMQMNSTGSKSNKPAGNKFKNYEEREYDFASLERKAREQVIKSSKATGG